MDINGKNWVHVESQMRPTRVSVLVAVVGSLVGSILFIVACEVGPRLGGVHEMHHLSHSPPFLWSPVGTKEGVSGSTPLVETRRRSILDVRCRPLKEMKPVQWRLKQRGPYPITHVRLHGSITVAGIRRFDFCVVDPPIDEALRGCIHLFVVSG